MSALILVDIQNDFADEKGSLYVQDGSKIVPIVNTLKKNPNFNAVFCTLDFHPVDHCSFVENNPGAALFSTITLPSGVDQVMWPTHCIQYSWGSNLHPEIERSASDIMVLKGDNKDIECYSGFGQPKAETRLAEFLRERNIKKVFVCGLALDYCVAATAFDAQKLGYETFVITDAAKGVAPATCASKTAELTGAGIKFVSSSEILNGCVSL